MDFYSIAEVSELSNQSQKTIRRHIAAGKLKAEKVGGSYRIPKENYEKWLQSDLDPEKDNIFNETIVDSSMTDEVNWVDITDKWIYDGEDVKTHSKPCTTCTETCGCENAKLTEECTFDAGAVTEEPAVDKPGLMTY